MVRTHPNSWFSLLTLDQIRDSKDVLLQIDKTDTTFAGSNKSCYLCEGVSSSAYENAKYTVSTLVNEIVRVNTENRRLLNKIQRLEKVIANADR